MQKDFQDLAADELLNIDGGMEAYGCALLGAFTGVAFITMNWWALAGGLIASYNSGCFDF